jgi:hypothetical protein
MYKSQGLDFYISVRLERKGASSKEAKLIASKILYGAIGDLARTNWYNGIEPSIEEILVNNPDKSLVDYCENLMRYDARIVAGLSRDIP